MEKLGARSWIAAGITILIIVIIFIIGAIIEDKKSTADIEETEGYIKNKDAIELQYRVSLLANRLDLIIDYMKETDQFIFGEDDFKDHDMYTDFILYGDDKFIPANDVEGKTLYLGNLIGNINYHMDDIMTFYYSLGNKRSKYNHLFIDINSDISEINECIDNYNKSHDTEISHVSYLKDVTIKTDLTNAKKRWEAIEGAIYPQGEGK